MKPHNSKRQQGHQTRINGAITAHEVLIITEDGETQGPCPVQQALQMARDTGLDLVEVASNVTPPVCKILDYGKFKYNQNKKTKATVKKKQLLKEIRMQPKISDHDLKFKTNHVQEFLLEGNKVKVTIRFKGRELAHTELGEVILNRILDILECSFTVDKNPSMEGRTMTMMLSPSSKSKRNNKKAQAPTPTADKPVEKAIDTPVEKPIDPPKQDP